ncbi:MipA/OmpV family protein [Cupriavidus basilensis]
MPWGLPLREWHANGIVSYEISRNWSALGSVTFARLRGDAASSPITERRQQWTAHGRGDLPLPLASGLMARPAVLRTGPAQALPCPRRDRGGGPQRPPGRLSARSAPRPPHAPADDCSPRKMAPQTMPNGGIRKVTVKASAPVRGRRSWQVVSRM